MLTRALAAIALSIALQSCRETDGGGGDDMATPICHADTPECHDGDVCGAPCQEGYYCVEHICFEPYQCHCLDGRLDCYGGDPSCEERDMSRVWRDLGARD